MDSDDKAGVIILIALFVVLPIVAGTGLLVEKYMTNNHQIEMKKLEVEKAKWEATTRPAVVPITDKAVEKS